MNSIENKNFFTDNPIKNFVGAGFEKYRPHWHWERRINNASLYYIGDGNLKFTLKDKSFVVSKGDVVFLKASDIATIANETDTYSSLIYIAFKLDETDKFLSETVFFDTTYRSLFKEILDAHLSKAPFSNLKILQSLSKLIYNLLNDCLSKNEDYASTSRIHAAAEYININYYKDLSLEELCRISGYSPAHLRRLFIKTFGFSPREYIIDKRIEMATEMLFDVPEKTIGEIADLVGIGSSSYFCKMFKEKTGLSPNDYKKKSNDTSSSDING